MYSSIADIRLDLLTRETNCPPSLLLRISCSSRGSGASSSSSCIYPNTLPLAYPGRIQIQITRHTPGIPGIRCPALALNHSPRFPPNPASDGYAYQQANNECAGYLHHKNHSLKSSSLITTRASPAVSPLPHRMA